VYVCDDIFTGCLKISSLVLKELKTWFLCTVPSQPSNLRTSEVGETSVTLQWSRPAHAGENIVSYELYWNDTYAKVPLPVGLLLHIVQLLFSL
jgi:hypothetical protein